MSARQAPVLVTGATGFLGSRVARALLAAGRRVRLLHRPGREDALAAAVAPAADQEPHVEPVEGDLRDADSLRRACEGCSGVVHLAARVSRGGPRAAFEDVNVAGLRRVLDAARETGAGRVVATSSFFALGPSEDGRPRDEGALERLFFDGEDAGRDAAPGTVDPGAREQDAYAASKRAAALEALGARFRGADVVVSFPGVVVGPGPMSEGNFVTALILEHLKGGLVPLPGGGRAPWSFVHVDDVARAHVVLLETERPAPSYVLGGENASLADLFDVVADLTGHAPPRLSVPLPALWLAGAGEELLERATGRAPRRLTRGAARLMVRAWPLDSRRARRDLAFDPRSVRQLVHETIAWMIAQGRLPPATSRGRVP